jgi:DNA-binding MarR family transcriptional regulator
VRASPDPPGRSTVAGTGVRDALRILARLSRVMGSADSGLTVPQYRTLCALSEGGERSARLAERLAVRKPTLTAVGAALETRPAMAVRR